MSTESRQESRERRANEDADRIDQGLVIVRELLDECQQVQGRLEARFAGTTRYQMVSEAVDTLDKFVEDVSTDNLRGTNFGWENMSPA